MNERARLRTKAIEKERLPLIDMVTFSMGAFGKDAGNTLVGVYYMFFLTQVLSLNAALVGVIFAISRLFFAFSSPIIGTLIDNTRTRIGKYRPWILSTVIIGSVALLFMFTNMSLVNAARYIFYLSFYVIWEIANLSLDISVWAFLPTITYNKEDRNKVTSFSKLSSGLGSGIIAAGAPFFLSYFFHSEFEPEGYFYLAIIAAFIMTLGGYLIFQLNKERVKIDSTFVKVKDLFKSLFQNDQLIAYLVSFLLINLAGSITGNFAIYFFAYDFGEMKYYGLFVILTGLGQGIGIFTYPLLAKRAPIRTILIISTISSILGYLLMLIIIVIFGVNSIILICSVAVLMLFSGGWLATASQSMLVDITDYGEYKLGNRTGSIIFSANTMMWRIISAMVILVLGISLSIAGLNGVDMNSGLIPEISLKGLWIIRIMMFGVPVLFITIGLIIFLSKYNLNAREMAVIQDSLAERYLKSEEKKQRKEEMKHLSEQLKEAKKAYKKNFWAKTFTSTDKITPTERKSFRRVKKVSVDSAKKRMSIFRKAKDEDDKDEFDIK